MHFLEIVFIIVVNTGILFVMQRFQNRVLDRKLKLFKTQVQEMEDLVAAIIEEFEAVAGMPVVAENNPTFVASEPVLEPVPLKVAEPSETTYTNGANDSRHQLILELSHRGLTVEEIAKELGTGRGEVSLILGLYQRS